MTLDLGPGTITVPVLIEVVTISRVGLVVSPPWAPRDVVFEPIQIRLPEPITASLTYEVTP